MKPSRRFSIVAFIGLCILIAGSAFFINANSRHGSMFNSEQFVLAAGLVLFGVSMVLYLGAIATDRYYKKYDPKVKLAYEEELLAQDLDERSLYFLEIPTSTLYYANVKEINNIYKTYFEDDIITSIISETSEEAGGEINALFSKIIGFKQAGKDSKKVVKKYKPKEETTLGKFIRYQRAVILQQQVDISLDLVDIDFQEINELDDTLKWLFEVYGIGLDESYDEINTKRNALFEKASEETLVY